MGGFLEGRKAKKQAALCLRDGAAEDTGMCLGRDSSKDEKPHAEYGSQIKTKRGEHSERCKSELHFREKIQRSKKIHCVKGMHSRCGKRCKVEACNCLGDLQTLPNPGEGLDLPQCPAGQRMTPPVAHNTHAVMPVGKHCSTLPRLPDPNGNGVCSTGSLDAIFPHHWMHIFIQHYQCSC